MANGIVCKQCGHQETSHDLISTALVDEEGERKINVKKSELEDIVGGSTTRIRGYKKALKNCKGYEPEDPKGHEKFEDEGRGTHGMFGTSPSFY
jgi:hypothetical protein